MLLLVTDTSGKNGSVALARSDSDQVEVVESVPLAGGTFSAQLVPQIAALLEKHGFRKTEIDAFIVVSGPGSFTGLRVGLSAIKALAEILQKPIVAVSLLEVIALAAATQGKVFTALDAGRGEVYAGEYEVVDSARLVRERLITRSEFLSGSQGVAIATPDVELARAVRESGAAVVSVALPTAAEVAKAGYGRLKAGFTVSPEGLEANYIRRSDAEIFAHKS